jgi:membrane-bound lytic murein transglycosylase B
LVARLHLLATQIFIQGATMRLAKILSAAVLTTVLSAPALAATCNHPGGMDAFLAEFKKEAAAKGISRKGNSALDGVTVDPAVLAADKRQGVFKQTFEEFSGRMISSDRMTKGMRHMHTHARRSRRSSRASACRAPWWSRCGVSRPTTAPTSARRK